MITKEKIKFIIKLNINNNSKSLDPKVSTVLGQRRLNSADIFNNIKLKIADLNIKQLNTVVLKVLVVVLEKDDYLIYIKMPSLTSLINQSLKTNRNFNIPGFIMLSKLKLDYFNLTITPYILYEILKFKLRFELTEYNSLRSYFKKNISSLKSKGINIYLNENNK